MVVMGIMFFGYYGYYVFCYYDHYADCAYNDYYGNCDFCGIMVNMVFMVKC
jgi:hypothetical protein